MKVLKKSKKGGIQQIHGISFKYKYIIKAAELKVGLVNTVLVIIVFCA